MANRKLRIKYLKAHDFKTSLTTGVYGGLTTNGMININFFTDRSIIPRYQNIEVTEKGIPVGIPQDEKDGDLIREVQYGALMDVHTARIVVTWLDSKIEEFDKAFPNEKPDQ